MTALTGLASHRDAVWIASALTDGDARKAARGRGQGVHRALAGGRRVPGAPGRQRPRRLRPLLQHLRQPDAVVHPALPLGPLQRPGHPAQRGRGVRVRLQRRQRGPRDRRHRGDRGRRRAGRDGPRLPPLHAARRSCAARAPTSSCTTSSTSRGRRATPGACCPQKIREELYCGLLSNDIIGFHTSSYRRNFLQCCRDLMDLEVDFDAGVVHFEDREVWVRNYPLPIDAKALFNVAASDGVAQPGAGAAAPPARPPDPARRPRRPVQERPARLLRRSTSSSSSTRSSASA